MTEIETYSYDDDGIVEAETVIKFDETEFIVVQSAARDEHEVYQRARGDTQPHTKLAPEKKKL